MNDKRADRPRRRETGLILFFAAALVLAVLHPDLYTSLMERVVAVFPGLAA
ncbi:hypothetical protein H9Y04_14895 [Streptomyces sp. TRM66268-LWL]|uniref:Uncharacterized protein n=1 Tax=Streptomyces polyasparticus TaxID=2767826 RepID=A0ABR7SEC7_9ACTN|nr:hypothetical protein [Streptomyces polyasparticus]MBC9713857.1 hypothetical protein [Streptomyces polyasparticus]